MRRSSAEPFPGAAPALTHAIATAPSQNSCLNAGEQRGREGDAGWTCWGVCDVKQEALFVL